MKGLDQSTEAATEGRDEMGEKRVPGDWLFDTFRARGEFGSTSSSIWGG